jgi:hypothetical protein
VSLPYFAPGCTNSVDGGALEDTIVHFSALVGDPSGRVVFVTIHMSSSGMGGSFNDTLVLNQSAGGRTGTRTFSGDTVELNADLVSALVGRPGSLSWQSHAFDGHGVIVAMDSHSMLVGPCAPPIFPDTLGVPTPTEGIISLAPTATPASAQDCPPGTYFAQATHRCIAVQVQPTRAGGGACQPPPSGCFPLSWLPAQCKCGVP